MMVLSKLVRRTSYEEKKKKKKDFRPGMGKLRSRAHVRSVKLFNPALQT